MKNKPVQQKRATSPQALRNLRRQRATKANLAKGFSTKEAMLAAGYSPLYVQHQGYKAIKRPCIQSAFTDSCERIMAKRHLQFDQIVEPYFDALTAKLIVKSSQLGDAQQTDLPDYPLRMNAADRLVDLYGGDVKVHEQDDGDSDESKLKKSIRVVFVSVNSGNGHANGGTAKVVNSPPLKVSFVPAQDPPRRPRG
jgi:hypothetical protein